MSFDRDTTILFVPGLRDHVEDHWQTHAARAIPGAATVASLDADRLSRAAQVAAVDAALRAIPGDAVIVAHSAGCMTAVHWALAPTRPIRAALLVAPADLETPLPAGYPKPTAIKEGGWLPIPRKTLPFPAIVVASRNDPLAAFDRVAHFAGAWGAALHDVGEVGHLNPAAGYGPWPEVANLLGDLADHARSAAL